MPSRDASWDFRSHSSKDRMLAVMRHEYEDVLGLVSDPEGWHRPTACAGWQVRHMVGHFVEATEGYLQGFAAARQGGGGDVVSGGVVDMAAAYDRAARTLGELPRDELLGRFRNATETLLTEFESLSADEWSGLIVCDPFAGPLPAMVIVVAVLGGYTVHGWDLRQGAGMLHAVSADAADLLVPFVFALWAVTADTASVGQTFAIGIRTSGRNGGDTVAHVANDGITFESAEIGDDCGAMLELDPGTLVLTVYGRVNAGTVHGDSRLTSTFRSLFRAI
jgi:uncharacterized protein (TIGR03083 family)